LIILKDAFKKTALKKDTFFRLIDFQYFDLERQSELNTMEDLEIYAENTRSLMLYLTLNLLNISDKNAYLAASHIGRGVGMVDVLKKMPGLYRLNVNMIPLSVIERVGAHSFNLWDRHGSVADEFYDAILE
jgi:phytoene/squalene synthetase